MATDKYQGIIYDNELVNKKLAEYKKANPQASPQELENAEKDFVITEAIVFSYAQVSCKEKNITDPKAARKETQSIRDQLNSMARTYFLTLSEPELSEYLKVYQNRMKKFSFMADVKSMNAQYAKLISTKTEKRDFVESYGKAYHKGVFGRVTDSSGMLFENMDRKDGTQILRGYQAQIDQIRIPESNYLDDTLTELAVFGRCLSPELMLGEKGSLKTGGSSAAKEFEDYDNLMVFFYENGLTDDNRMNTHAFRSVAPKARQIIKDEIVLCNNDPGEENKKALNAELLKAFENLLGYGMTCRDPKKSLGYVGYQLKRLLTSLDKQNISYESVGISPEKLEKAKFLIFKSEMAAHIAELRADIKQYAGKWFHEGPGAYECDPRQNPQLHDATVELIAYEKILRQIDQEVYTLGNISLIKGSSTAKDRQFTPTELMLRQDPEGLIEYYKDLVREDPMYRRIQDAKDPETIQDYLNHSGTSNIPASYIYQDAMAFERLAAADCLNKAKEFFTEVKGMLPDLGYPKFISTCDRMISLIDEINAEREKGKNPDSGTEKLETLYKKFHDAYKKLRSDNILLIDEIDNLSSSQKYSKYLNVLTEADSIYSDWKSGREKQSRIMESIAGRKPGLSFDRNYDSYAGALEYVSKDRKMDQRFHELMLHLARLKERLAGKGDIIEGKLTAGEAQKDYSQILSELDTLLTEKKIKGMNDDIKFVLKEIQTGLSRDFDMVKAAAAQDPDLDFNLAFSSYRASQADHNVQTGKEAISDRILAMKRISSRVGGNSDEFKKLLDAANALDPKASLYDYRDKVEALKYFAQEYIVHKKIVPSTDKGKERLQIAMQIRDICSNLCADLGGPAYNEQKNRIVTNTKDLKAITLQEKKEGLEGLKKSWEEKDGDKLVQSLAKMLYMGQVEKYLKKLPYDEVDHLLSEKVQRDALRKLENLAPEVLRTFNVHDFDKAVKESTMQDNKIEKLLNRKFVEYVKRSPELVEEKISRRDRLRLDNPVIHRKISREEPVKTARSIGILQM